MGKKGPLWWRESDWLLRGSSAANQILLRHSGPILSLGPVFALQTVHTLGFFIMKKISLLDEEDPEASAHNRLAV